MSRAEGIGWDITAETLTHLTSTEQIRLLQLLRKMTGMEGANPDAEAGPIDNRKGKTRSPVRRTNSQPSAKRVAKG